MQKKMRLGQNPPLKRKSREILRGVKFHGFVYFFNKNKDHF
jgi:hypothetical protein